MVTLASVAVNEGVARLLSFLENNHIVHRPISLTVTQLVIYWQMFCVLLVWVAWKWLLLKSTVILNAGCSVLPYI